MQPEQNLPKSFQFRNPRQQQIYEHLLLIGPGPAAFYKDACHLMQQKPPLKSTTHLVGHLLREVESAIRDVLLPMSEHSSKEVSSSSDQKHREEILTILPLLGLPVTDPISVVWLQLSDRDDGYALHRQAHRDDLNAPRKVDDDFEKFLQKIEALFAVVLTRFREKYLNVHKILDDLLAKGNPGKKDAEALKKNTPNNLLTLSYFFDKCASLNWLDPLRKTGFFNHPPEIEKDEEKNTIRFPPWPAARYLARMAKVAPGKVFEVVSIIPETENISVHEDLADVAINMLEGGRADLAAVWTEKESTWIVDRRILSFRLLPDKLGLLIELLSKKEQGAAALKLAQSLLDVLPDPRGDDSQNEKTYPSLPEPRARFDLWEYGEIIKKNIPELVRAKGIQAFILLCGFLEKAIGYSRRKSERSESDDFSYIWRESIRHGKENHSHGIENLLVTAVRDAAQLLIEENKAKIQEIVDILKKYKWQVYNRLILHILTMFPDKPLVIEYLTRREYFDDHTVRREYAVLIGKQFYQLDENIKQTILDWVKDGPNSEEFRSLREKIDGNRPSDEEVEKNKLFWQRNHLAWFKDQLSEEWKIFYQKLVKELGDVEDSTYPFRLQTGWAGPTSPKSVEEFKQMPVEEIVKFLKTWEFADAMMTPSPEGLGRVLTELVKQDSDRFCRGIMDFKGVHPTYVRALITGLSTSVKENRIIDWQTIISFFQWIVDQPREVTEGAFKVSHDCDPNWGWTRSSLARFLSESFEEEHLPFVHRVLAWNVLKPLTDDPDPTVEYEAKQGPSSDPATISINTTRGEALHAVMRYAWWVRINLAKQQGLTEKCKYSFDGMIEVREVLEKHLDIQQDASLAIRSVYGQWLPWLVLMDKVWTQQNTPKIFPEEADAQQFHLAAWETYIVFCQAYDNVFETVRDQYAKAISCIKDERKNGNRLGDPNEHLAEHLMVFYWRGKIDLEDSMWNQFWAEASPKVRGRAIEFIGRTLYSDKGNVPQDIHDRFKKLWVLRVQAAKTAVDSEQHRSEMEAFGWWYISKKFDEEWAIQQLIEAVKISRKTEPDHLVVEHLAGTADKRPNDVTQVLRLISEGDKEGWAISSWADKAKEALKIILKTEARSSAENLINYLVSRGYLEFSALLN